jgi:hypothetical protein
MHLITLYYAVLKKYLLKGVFAPKNNILLLESDKGSEIVAAALHNKILWLGSDNGFEGVAF